MCDSGLRRLLNSAANLGYRSRSVGVKDPKPCEETLCQVNPG